MSTYDFSTLYPTLPHNLIKEKLIEFYNLFILREYVLMLMKSTTETSFLLLSYKNKVIDAINFVKLFSKKPRALGDFFGPPLRLKYKSFLTN